LITGHVPLELERVDWERQLLQEDPLPPSQMLRFRTVPLRDSGTSETLQSPIVVKGATQARLRKQCRGDLDKVILKALKKSPKDRYQSVEELRQDLERFQQEVPVAAHPIGAFERVRRWSGAHWVQACLLAASSVVMMLSMPFSVLHYVEYNAREIDRDHAVQRLRNLAEIGFRHIEVSLPAGADSAEARVAFAQIEREMLRGIETLPQQTKRQLDRTFIISSLDLAVQWRELGEFGKALETLSPAIERANYRYLAEPRIGIWREVYARLLEERIGLNSQFGRDEQSAEDVRALVLLQRSGRRGAKE
jgi:hypothetical protein